MSKRGDIYREYQAREAYRQLLLASDALAAAARLLKDLRTGEYIDEWRDMQDEITSVGCSVRTLREMMAQRINPFSYFQRVNYMERMAAMDDILSMSE